MQSPASPIRPAASIRLKMLFLMASMTAVAAVSIAAIAIYVSQASSQGAQEVSNRALLDQAEDYLTRTTQANARELDQILDEVKRQTVQVAAFAAGVLSSDTAYHRPEFWLAEAKLTRRADGQYANGVDDPASVFIPNTADYSSAILRDAEMSAYLDAVLSSTFHNTPNLEAVYFATPRDLVRYYPNVNLGEVLPPDFRASQRIWFTGSAPQDNPEKMPWWTPPYLDATGLGLVTTAAAPVYSASGEFLGVVGMDLTLNQIRERVNTAGFLESSYSFLVDSAGRAVALPDQGFVDILGRQPEAAEVAADLTQPQPAFAPLLTKMLAGETGLQTVTVAGRSLYVAYAPLPSAGWSLGSVIEASAITQTTLPLRESIRQSTRSLIFTRIVPITALIFLLVVATGLVLANRLVVPLRNLIAKVQKFGAGDYNVTIAYAGNDEIGLLAANFNTMAAQIRSSVGMLEARVSERTRELEQRTNQIQVAAEIAREAAAIRDLDALLNHAVNLIRSRFGFYHAGIFLLDARNEYAVLRAAASEAARELLSRGHRLRVGAVGIVGYVTGSGLPRIALDVSADPTYFRNPLLPDTRSEMALPLKIGERIIGALDVQSQDANAFSQEDVNIMQVLADQLTIAIENARLFQSSQESLHELERLYGRFSRDAWETLGKERDVVGYYYDGRNTLPITAHKESILPDAESGVHVPLAIRGQVVATLDVWPPAGEDLSLTQQEILRALGDRLAQALEGARLYDEARARAAREERINLLGAQVRNSVEIETILQTTVREIGKALGASRTYIQIASPTGQNGGEDPGETPAAD
ncbi:MAG: GAF domain-containing protein [Chloroflexi bacterium]|nr:GAF domain-containing protein [Chloroflexota bacterium]